MNVWLNKPLKDCICNQSNNECSIAKRCSKVDRQELARYWTTILNIWRKIEIFAATSNDESESINENFDDLLDLVAEEDDNDGNNGKVHPYIKTEISNTVANLI